MKLHPNDLHAYGLNRGGIAERWFGSTIPAAGLNSTAVKPYRENPALGDVLTGFAHMWTKRIRRGGSTLKAQTALHWEKVALSPLRYRRRRNETLNPDWHRCADISFLSASSPVKKTRQLLSLGFFRKVFTEGQPWRNRFRNGVYSFARSVSKTGAQITEDSATQR
jgi:hypothetical protein